MLLGGARLPWESGMFAGNDDLLATGFKSRGSNGEAINGFSAIAAAVDQGIDLGGISNGRIVDFVAIGLGWLLLVTVIIYPALQLAAVMLCAVFMCIRSRHCLTAKRSLGHGWRIRGL